jgi:hypothetical protein
MDLEGSNFALYRSYTIRLVPLRPERELSLRSISFSNADRTVLACGIPSRFAHLFMAPTSPRRLSAAASKNGTVGKAYSKGMDSLPPPLVPRPDQKVVVGYITPGSDIAAGAAPAVKAVGGKAPVQQQYLLKDPWTNATVVWSKFTPAVCTPDRYVLVPLGQVHSSMRMMPELLDSGADGVKISISEATFALSPQNGSSVAASAFGSGGVPVAAAGCAPGKSSSSTSSSSSSDSTTLCSSSSGSGGGSSSSSGALGGVGGVTSRMRLPGVTAELPVITTADEGRSSKTYTLLLYSNDTAATALQQVQVPAAATRAVDMAVNGGNSSSTGGGSGSDMGEDGEDLTQAVFGNRPPWWPKSPAQSGNCTVCQNGTYSNKMNAQDCQVGFTRGSMQF